MDIRDDIFNIMKSYGYTMKMYDAEGNGPLVSPVNAEYFYAFKGDRNFMIVIEDDNSRYHKHITLYKAANVAKEEFRSILKSIQDAAIKNTYSTTIKDMGKELSPKDFALDPIIKAERHVEESFDVTGSTKTSYHLKERAKVIVKHYNSVNEKLKGSRSRNIKEVFVAAGGEKRRVSEKSLVVGKAVANYVNGGGSLYDNNTNMLITLGEDIKRFKSVKLTECFEGTDDEKIGYFDSLIREARMKINRFIGNLAKRKTKLDEGAFDFMSGPQYDFSKAYFSSFTDDAAVVESLARASMFLDLTGE